MATCGTGGRSRYVDWELRVRWLGAALAVSSFACAPAQTPLADARAAMGTARSACHRLGYDRLRVPVQTQVAARLQEIAAAERAGDPLQAQALSRRLEEDCQAERQQRADLRNLIQSINEEGPRIKPAHGAMFRRLTRSGAYTRAIICGERLLQGHTDRCEEPSAEEARRLRPFDGVDSLIAGDAAAAGAMPAPSTGAGPAPVDADAADPTAAADAPRGPTPDALPEITDAYSGTATAAAAAPRPAARKRVWTWVALGSGGALLATGAVLAGLAQARYNDLSDRCPDCSQADIDGGKRLALSADILFGVGAAAAATGVVLFFVEGGGGDSAHAAITRGKTSAFRVQPAPAGLSIVGSF